MTCVKNHICCIVSNKNTYCISSIAISVSCAFLSATSPTNITEKGTSRVEELGDYSVTAYLGIMHRDSSRPSQCGEINTQAGFLFFEAIRYAVRQINKNSSYLYGAKLGYRVVNTCKNTLILKDQLTHGILDQRSVAVVGPPTSDEAIFVSPIFNIFGVPVVSHHATGMDLEDRQRYGNFFRTVPSDRHQVIAMINIIKALNWTYVYIINSHGNFGERGIDFFVSAIQTTKICVARRVTLSDKTSPIYFKFVIRSLLLEKNVKVVVLYTSQEDTTGLLQAAKEMKVAAGQFIWLASTNFKASIGDVSGEVADGALFLSYKTSVNEGFREYMHNLKPQEENFPWFRMFWEKIFNCSFRSGPERTCTGNESLANSEMFQGSAPVQSVISAVYSIACGIRGVFEYFCGHAPNKTNCVHDIGRKGGISVRTGILRKLVSRSLNCDQPFPSAKFLYDGSVPGSFDVLHYQYRNRSQKILHVGSWEDSFYGPRLAFLDVKKIRFGPHTTGIPKSVCAYPCGVGEVKEELISNPKCCWRCVKCSSSQFLFNNTCRECPQAHLPKDDQTTCYKLPSVYVNMKSALSITVLVFCFIGVKLTTVTLGIFLKFWETRVVKASSRELSAVMIVGLYMCFMAPLFFLSEPTLFVCAFQRFIVGVSLVTCYTPLLLKTNRIYRIFESAKKGLKRPTLVSPRSQVLICLGLIAIQCLFAIAWVAGKPPRIVSKMDVVHKKIQLSCSQNELAMAFNLGLCGVLMLICTFYAVKTRKFPKNYNESRSIGITMYLSCFLWGVFIPLYAYSGGRNEERVYYLSCFCVLIAFVTLVGLFFQRIYILLFVKGGKSEERSQSSSNDTKSAIREKSYKITQMGAPSQGVCKCKRIRFENKSINDRSTDTDNEDVD